MKKMIDLIYWQIVLNSKSPKRLRIWEILWWKVLNITLARDALILPKYSRIFLWRYQISVVLELEVNLRLFC